MLAELVEVELEDPTNFGFAGTVYVVLALIG